MIEPNEVNTIDVAILIVLGCLILVFLFGCSLFVKGNPSGDIK